MSHLRCRTKLRQTQNVLHIQMQVQCGGELGPPIRTSNLGIKQGGLLSPLKLGAFMEQLHDLISLRPPGIGPKLGILLVSLLMYADDVTFGMKVNASKTFAVVFNNARVSKRKQADLVRSCKWKLNGQAIAIKEEAKFLGCTFHQSKGCLVAPEALAIKGRKATHAMLVLMRKHHINQSAFLCRMFDQIVEPVLSYGCHVWGPDIFHKQLQVDTIFNRNRNPAEAVHIDFLRLIGGLPPSSPLWILFWEFNRFPLHFHWISLCARFWQKVLCSNEDNVNVLLRQALRDDIELALNKAQHCWAFKFLTSLVTIGALSQNVLDECISIEQVLALPISEDTVEICLQNHWKALVSNITSDLPKSREAPDDAPITFARYEEWVQSGKPPLHLTTFMPTHLKHSLVRLRSTGFPLLAYSHVMRRQGIPRSQRFCKACASEGRNCIEDDLHFLIECPLYSNIRSKFGSIFHENASPSSIYDFSDQSYLGKAIKSMLLRRSTT